MTKLNYARRLIALVMVAAATSFGMAQAKAISTVASNVQQVGMHELQVDTAGILDYDERDAASNVVLDFYVGSGASITSLKWDVNLTSYVGSYLSEMKLTFSDSLGKGVTFTPGYGDDFDGTANYAGFQNLGGLGQIFAVGADGILRLEFHDGFKDLAFDEPEGIWNSGTLIFGVSPVPEPPVFAMALAGLLLISAVIKRRHC
jgi:hypothetical protein